MKRTRIAILVVALVAVAWVASAGGALAKKPPAATYLAMGDSLAVGVGVIPAHQQDQFGYVGRFNHWFKDSREGPHSLVNVGVAKPGGETSATFISEGQLAAAVEAIGADSDVQLVTLNIGGNDLDNLRDEGGPCAMDPGSDACQAAVQATFITFAANYQYILGTVLAELAQDPGDETLMVMTQYNPFDGTGHPWENAIDLILLSGDMKIDCSGLGNPANIGLNDLIACIGSAYGAEVVDVYPAFADKALALTHIAQGDIHPNKKGYRVIADEFEAVAQ